MIKESAPVSLWRMFRKFGPAPAVIPLIAAIITGGIAMTEGRKAERLESDGAVAQALVVEKRVEVSEDSDGDKTTDYYLDIVFDAGGQSVSQSRRVSESFHRQTAEGGTIEIRYWRPDPRVSEIEPGSTGGTIFITKLIAIAALVAAGLWLERCWGRARRALRVRDTGVERRAEVIAHVDSRVRFNRVPQFRLHWRDSENRSGQSLLYPAAALAPYPPGTTITVYADPADRLQPVWQAEVGPARAEGAVTRN